MSKTSAYCPASISLIFKIFPDKNPVRMGSTGLGFTVDKGVIVTVSTSRKNAVYFNGKGIIFPTVATVVKKLGSERLKIDIESPLPLGYGFGISAACSLGAAWAINKLLGLKKSSGQLTEIAHVAEIENKTGLGSVATQVTGGFLLKTAPGLPVEAVKFPFIGQKIHTLIVDRLITSEVLGRESNWRVINQAADEALDNINKISQIKLNDLIDIAYNFSQKSKLLYHSQVKKIINIIRSQGGHASMAMLGQVVISSRRIPVGGNLQTETLTVTSDKVGLIHE